MKKSMRDSVTRYYTEKVQLHGPTAQGVDWNSLGSQQLRFEQLLKVCDTSKRFSINDYGCGYGALYAFLQDRSLNFEYTGFDWSSKMLEEAVKLYGSNHNCRLILSGDDDSVEAQADYTVASGIFNVRLNESKHDWQEYILDTLRKFNAMSLHGFSFNMLTSYSDSDYMRSDLHYGDPGYYFDYCKRNFSSYVALLHDYGLYEFTVLVRSSNSRSASL